jgi:transposase
VPRPYLSEFRARAIALVRSGKPVQQTSYELGISAGCLHNWLKQDRIDRGEIPGKTTIESVELRSARKRIRELETEMAIPRQAGKFLGPDKPHPKGSTLVIDQPEDDLDNRYIYDEVVKVLADVCQRLIVATHNANIPILGDADLVLALDADGKRARVLACGGLEDPDVTEWARRILEGGDTSFQARHRRYQAGRS